MLIEKDENDLLATTEERVIIRAAVASGSVANIVHPNDLQAKVEVTPDMSRKHFDGAGGCVFDKFCACFTFMGTKQASNFEVCWQILDFTRAPSSVSETCDLYEGDGRQDCAFNNKKCDLNPPGIAGNILQHIKPAVGDHCSGGLNLTHLAVSRFGRRGATL